MEALFKQYLCHGTRLRRITQLYRCILCASGAGIVEKDVMRFTAGGRSRVLLSRIRHVMAGAAWLVTAHGRTVRYAVAHAGAGTVELSTAAAPCPSCHRSPLRRARYRALGPSPR